MLDENVYWKGKSGSRNRENMAAEIQENEEDRGGIGEGGCEQEGK